MAGDRTLTAAWVPALPNKSFSPVQWRAIYRTPPDARFETVGTCCPLDDALLRVRLDGWFCPKCTAAWDFRGEAGRWLPLADAVPAQPSRFDRRLAVAVGAGIAVVLGLVTGVALQPSVGPVSMVLVMVGLELLAVAGLAYGWRASHRRAGDDQQLAIGAAAAEVRDGR